VGFGDLTAKIIRKKCEKIKLYPELSRLGWFWNDGNKLHQTSSDPPIQDDLSRFSWCNKQGFPVKHLQITSILHVRKVSNCTDCIPMFNGKNQGFGCFEPTCS
jgi:hypothetical protein